MEPTWKAAVPLLAVLPLLQSTNGKDESTRGLNARRRWCGGAATGAQGVPVLRGPMGNRFAAKEAICVGKEGLDSKKPKQTGKRTEY